jgi:hypothetical protein
VAQRLTRGQENSGLSLVLHERKIRFVPRAALAILAPDLAPLAAIDRRESRPALRVERDFGDEEPPGARYLCIATSYNSKCSCM